MKTTSFEFIINDSYLHNPESLLTCILSDIGRTRSANQSNIPFPLRSYSRRLSYTFKLDPDCTFYNHVNFVFYNSTFTKYKYDNILFLFFYAIICQLLSTIISDGVSSKSFLQQHERPNYRLLAQSWQLIC